MPFGSLPAYFYEFFFYTTPSRVWSMALCSSFTEGKGKPNINIPTHATIHANGHEMRPNCVH